MNKLFTIISAVFILMSSCAIGQNQNDISIEELKNKIASQKYILVDVRTSEEYNNGHLKGSINIDYFSDNFSEEISSLGLESPILVYCRSGNRSGKAMNIMYDLGFKEVKNLIGGYKSWISGENLIIKE